MSGAGATEITSVVIVGLICVLIISLSITILIVIVWRKNGSCSYYIYTVAFHKKNIGPYFRLSYLNSTNK